MEMFDVTAIAERCFSGEPAGCSGGCPFGLDVRAVMEKAAKGKWSAAYKMYRNAVVFPVAVSKLCAAGCKEGCGRVDLGDEAIDMPLIERAVVGYTKKKNVEQYVIPPKEQRVAVVGAGVSGLACALDLARKKYLVTVFDENGGWGGALREYADFLSFDDDFTLQFSAVSITWEFRHKIADLGELAGFDAIYLATGGGGDDFGLADGYDSAVFSTKNPGAFMGGGVVGAAFAESIVAGTKAALHIEAYLQTGRVDSVYPAKKNCSHHVSNEGAEKAARVVPSSGGEYTEDEAMREAARCLLCDCTACLSSCEMLGAFRKKPQKIAMEIYTDSKAQPPYAAHTITRQTYSCNVCAHCKSVCPEGISMGELFMLSRRDRFDSGAAPLAMHDFWIREMEFHASEASFMYMPFHTPDRRAAADGAILPDNQNTKQNKDAISSLLCSPLTSSPRYVFFPGCQLGAYNPAHVLDTYRRLINIHNCGIYINCCGAPAFWAGDGRRLIAHVDSIRETSKALGNPIFIFACATCETMFGEYLPEIGRVPLYKLLAEDDALAPAPVYPEAAVFDPCAARGDGEMMDSVRAIAAKAGTKLSELSERNRCCGYGGLVRGGNPRMYERMVDNRAGMSDEPYIVYCSNCRDVFASRGKACAHILDIALGLPPTAEVPSISERRRNSIYVKTTLARELNDEMFVPEAKPWDGTCLVIDDDLAEIIDRKLISRDDMKEAVWLAETSGDRFVDEADGSVSACLVRRLLTYWVRYVPRPDGGYEILDAYYHRMRLGAE